MLFLQKEKPANTHVYWLFWRRARDSNPQTLAGLPDFEFYWVTNLFVYFCGSFVSSRSSRKPAWLLNFSEKVPKTQ